MGMSLVEIVVAVAIVIILGASIAPNVLGIIDRERVEAASTTLEQITGAMTEMRGDNQDWPGRLSHLAWPIVDGVDRNICGATYAGKAGRWAGPYLDRTIPANGLLPIAIGLARDSLVREVVSGNDGFLKIEILDVMLEDAEALNLHVDADASATGGTVRWTTPPNGDGMVTVSYLRPIRGC